jgi:hypothetical protein
MLRYVLSSVFALCLFSPFAVAATADQAFEERVKDFGSVARGQVLTHFFSVTNNTGQPVHIASVRVSCGCVHALALQDRLAPGQSTAIQANMDTRRFSGVKRVTIFVGFDQPQYEEVRLSVQADSHDDLLAEPDGFTFGKVKRGSKASSTVNLSFAGGRWKVIEAQPASQYVQTEVKEVGAGRFQITAAVRDDAPAGNWFTEVWVKSDDPAMSRIRLPLSVEIAP